MKDLEIITLEMPQRYDALPTDEAKVRAYLTAHMNDQVIDSLVRKKFKGALKNATPWSDEHIPTTSNEDTFEIGDVTFLVTTKPTTKRPQLV